MKRYRANRAITVLGGRVRLTENQAAARGHLVRAIGDGIMQIIGPCCFKSGEVFQHDGLPKALLASVTELDPHAGEVTEVTPEPIGEPPPAAELAAPPDAELAADVAAASDREAAREAARDVARGMPGRRRGRRGR